MRNTNVPQIFRFTCLHWIVIATPRVPKRALGCPFPSNPAHCVLYHITLCTGNIADHLQRIIHRGKNQPFCDMGLASNGINPNWGPQVLLRLTAPVIHGFTGSTWIWSEVDRLHHI